MDFLKRILHLQYSQKTEKCIHEADISPNSLISKDLDEALSKNYYCNLKESDNLLSTANDECGHNELETYQVEMLQNLDFIKSDDFDIDVFDNIMNNVAPEEMETQVDQNFEHCQTNETLNDYENKEEVRHNSFFQDFETLISENKIELPTHFTNSNLLFDLGFSQQNDYEQLCNSLSEANKNIVKIEPLQNKGNNSKTELGHDSVQDNSKVSENAILAITTPCQNKLHSCIEVKKQLLTCSDDLALNESCKSSFTCSGYHSSDFELIEEAEAKSLLCINSSIENEVNDTTLKNCTGTISKSNNFQNLCINKEEDSGCDDYHSSDFEFITEDEANLIGLKKKYGTPKLKRPKLKLKSKRQIFQKRIAKVQEVPVENYQGTHEIPTGDDFFTLFNNKHAPAFYSEINYMEIKSIRAAGMTIEYDGLGFDLRKMPRPRDDYNENIKHEAEETARKIKFCYPSVNRAT